MKLTGPLRALSAYSERLTAELYLHTVTVEPYLGEGSYGHIYGPSVTLSPDAGTGVQVDETTRMVRASDGAEVVSSSTIFASLAQADLLAAGSRVTLPSGDVTVVISRAVRPEGPLPGRVEAACE